MLIQLYRWLISPFLGNCCRFHPTCSKYAQHALMHFSLPKASWLIIKRLSRCHPWHPGGLDPIPNSTLVQSEDQFE